MLNRIYRSKTETTSSSLHSCKRVVVAVGFDANLPILDGVQIAGLSNSVEIGTSSIGGAAPVCLFSLAHSWIIGGGLNGLMMGGSLSSEEDEDRKEEKKIKKAKKNKKEVLEDSSKEEDDEEKKREKKEKKKKGGRKEEKKRKKEA
jgi:hypothetical protein